ncbi:MAG: type II toxin-antitoxin system HicB family antitoxin [Candidatus Hinthialibacter sp.]
MLSELIFEIKDDEIEGGYVASALGYGIHTQGESVDELKHNIKEAVECYFDDHDEKPKLLRLHYVKDEVISL